MIRTTGFRLGRRYRTLRLQGRSDACIRRHRRAKVLQGSFQLSGGTAARRIQRRNSPRLDAAQQWRNHAVQVLVDQQPEHRQATLQRRGTRQTLSQVLRSMGIMAHIQHQAQALALPVEGSAIQAPHHFGCQQGRGNLRGIPRQVQQQIGLQRERGVFHRQVQQR